MNSNASEALLFGQNITTFTVLQWKNTWQTILWASVKPSHVDDRETRGGPLLNRPAEGEVFFEQNTDARAMFGGSLAVSLASMPMGYQLYTNLSLKMRLPRLEVSMGPSYTHSIGDKAYVDTVPDRNGEPQTIIGKRDLDQQDLRLSSTLVILRDLTFQLSSQMLLATIDCSDYNILQADSSETPTTYPDEYADFSFTDLRIQALLRWEYLPGSALYAVYTHAGNTFFWENGPNFTATFGDIQDQEREHIFLIKLSHHFG